MRDEPSIFISTTSADLQSARDAVAKVLTSLGYNPVWQDIAATDPGNLIEVLKQRIDPCDAMIQLVGHRYGAEPPEPDKEFGRVSYTQFEALHGEAVGKKVIYIFLPPEFPTDSCEPEVEEKAKLQEAYRKSLEKKGVLRHSAASSIELENRIFRVRDDLAELRQAIEKNRRRMFQLATLTLMVLLIIGFVILGLRESARMQQEGIQQIQTISTQQAEDLDQLREEETQQTAAVSRIEERVKEIRSLPAALRADRLASALASAHVEDLELLRKAGLNPVEIEVALAGKLPGSTDSVASLFFKNSKRAPESIKWLGAVIADGVNPNVTLDDSYYEERALIADALAAGNAPAVVALLEAGASPHPFQSLSLTSYSVPRFLFPLHYLQSNSRFTAEEKQAVAKAYQEAGVSTFTLPKPENDYSDYFGQIARIAESNQESTKLFGIKFSEPDITTGIGGKAIASNASTLTDFDWNAFLERMPRRIELDEEKTGRCNYFEELEIHHLIGVYFDKAYFLGSVRNRYAGYVLVEVSKDMSLWNAYLFMPNGPGLGFAKKEREDDIDPDRAWRKMSMKFDEPNGRVVLKDYYHFKVANGQ